MLCARGVSRYGTIISNMYAEAAAWLMASSRVFLSNLAATRPYATIRQNCKLTRYLETGFELPKADGSGRVLWSRSPRARDRDAMSPSSFWRCRVVLA